MHSLDLSFSQLNSLFRIYRHGAQRIADLAEGAHLSHCATSRLVSRLEREGLVSKQPNLSNRRERLVQLTSVGEAYLKELQKSTAAAYKNLFQDLPGSLAKKLQDVLEEVLPLLPPPNIRE